ncbi:MAG: hypothetical protein KatS3mg087_1874 [Patescibacteria group bacterium]|nr:MAG: hypothetical protein KatS3mg087_1874 [Patescibacteria group bacterium]
MSFKLNIQLTEKQKELREACLSGKYNIVFYGGAIRGGKTFGSFAVLLELAWKYPYSRWFVVRKEYTRLRTSTIPSFRKFLAHAAGINYDEVDNYVDTYSFRLSNYSEIVFIAENYERDKTLERFKGLEANGFLLEEVSELQEQTLQKCIERAGTNIITGMMYKGKLCAQPKPLIICTANPARNWIKQYFYDRYVEGTLPENIKYIPATAKDNPHIDEATKESWRTMSAKEYKIFVEGDWNVDDNNDAFYYAFNDVYHTTDAQYSPELPLHVSVDENARPAMHATVWQDLDGVITCIDEVIEPNLAMLCDTINERYKSHRNIVYIYGDATSNKADAKLGRHETFYTLIMNQIRIGTVRKLRVPKANAKHTERYVHINALLQGKYNVEIKFDLRKTKATQADLLAVRLDEKGGKLKEKVRKDGITYEKHGHLSDTVDYFLMEYCTGIISKHSGRNNFKVKTVTKEMHNNNLNRLI